MKVFAGLAALLAASLALGQTTTLTNSIGMEFVLVRPGEFVVGRFEPPYVRPPAPGAATPAAIDAGYLVIHLMKNGDANGDQALDRNEWIGLGHGLYSALDSERSGKLIRPQVIAGWPRVLGAPGFGSPGFAQPENVAARNTAAALFRLADRDADDYVTALEWNGLFADWFAAWTKDGPLAADDLAAALRASVPYPVPPPPPTAEEYERIERDARAAYRSGFTVRISEAYYIGRFEVTQSQWTKVMGSNPSTFTAALLDTDASLHPVDSVTWEQAREFVRRLNAMEGSEAYSLPTEFQWEYAARAGRSGEISWTDARKQAYTGIGGNRSTRPVGSMEPNALGLYDTLGNVWEWVADYYNGKLFADPLPPVTGTTHVLKGGGFLADVKNATYTTHAGGPGNGFDVGFRVARRVDASSVPVGNLR